MPQKKPDYMKTLSGRITLLTPNLDEASLITGSEVSNLEDMRAAARQIYQDYHIPCLIKGGHLTGNAVDILFDGRSYHMFERERADGNVHGTGCFLSSLILCFLVQGRPLIEACRLAGDKTKEAILRAVPVGKGQRLILVD